METGSPQDLRCLALVAALTLLGAGLAWAQPARAQSPAKASADAVLAAPAQARVAEPAPAPSIKASAGGGPSDGPAATPPDQVGVQLVAMFQHFRTLNWPTTGLWGLEGLDRLTATIVGPDGKASTVQGVASPPASQPRSLFVNVTTGEGSFVYQIQPDPGGYRVRSFTVSGSGQAADQPDVIIPRGGGTRTVAVPGGGSLSLTLESTGGPPRPG